MIVHGHSYGRPLVPLLSLLLRTWLLLCRGSASCACVCLSSGRLRLQGINTSRIRPKHVTVDEVINLIEHEVAQCSIRASASAVLLLAQLLQHTTLLWPQRNPITFIFIARGVLLIAVYVVLDSCWVSRRAVRPR